MMFKDLVIPEALSIDKDKSSDMYGRFIAEPFERGYGHTIGNSLRRILLSSLEGAAVTAVKIKGAMHEFSVLPGVVEDVINIILNLKLLRFKLYSSGPETLYLELSQEGEIKAKDIKTNSNVEIINLDQHILTLDNNGKIEMEIEVSKGRGYVSSDKNKKKEHPIGTIAVDAIFSPVVRVNYEVENTRIGQVTDYNKLIMEIWTDGSVLPQDALAYSAKILKDSLTIFINFDEDQVVEKKQGIGEKEIKEEGPSPELLGQSVEIIELSVRATNCLKEAKIKTLGDLIKKKEDDLLHRRNFGRKSLEEIKKKLKELGLSLNM
ncbi:DNA-directed RNA polymerase subunit alpha [bacterium]|nr:DNA-directed RNA polymerase subunit alpha [bacterium]